MECIEEGCARPKKRRTGQCDYHYRLSVGAECKIEGCSASAVGRGWCNKHWQRWKKHGDPLVVERVRNREYGHTRVNNNGYVVEYVPGHPQADESGKAMQHRRVMADYLGRPLTDFENVHHKNGVRDDNRMENLELWVVVQPKGQRVEDLLAYADWIIARYRGE
jgi:hypothetical protein